MQTIPLTLAALHAMSMDERWALIDSAAKPVRAREAGIQTCQPNYIAPLYTNTPMPHYITHDGTSIQLDADNVYNGTLTDDRTEMRWCGYTCQLYDGELKMCPSRMYAESYIQGMCNGVAFKFVNTGLEYGCWPGFLLLYDSPDRNTMTLHNAATCGALERVRHFIDVDSVDEHGATALWLAVMNDRVDVVEYLIQARARLDAEEDLANPFLSAVGFGRTNATIVELFVDAGAKYDLSLPTPNVLRRVNAKRNRCRRAAAATYSVYADAIPKDLVRLLCKTVWSTRFEKVWSLSPGGAGGQRPREGGDE